LIKPEKRADAYSILRMSNNAGIAIGPAVGGFLAAVSQGCNSEIAKGHSASGNKLWSNN